MFEEYAIAHRLGFKTIDELREMPVSRYEEWRQYFILTEKTSG